MGKTSDIKARIKSVNNTTKITRTMELIATAKAQTCQSRIQKALPYFHGLAEIAREAQKAGGGELSHPLLEQREPKRVAVLAVAANRGFCGGYNSNLCRAARDHRAKLEAEGAEVKLFASGKKAINWFKFQGIKFQDKTFTQFEDKPAFSDVEMVADLLAGLFLDGKVDRVDVAYTHYYSAGRQAPVVETLLPIQPADEGDAAVDVPGKGAVGRQGEGGEAASQYAANFLVQPDPQAILETLFPMQVRLHLFRVYLEAATSEQIARRIAMKNATDNGQEVYRDLRMEYNRARQNQITKEILEVIGGAEAVA